MKSFRKIPLNPVFPTIIQNQNTLSRQSLRTCKANAQFLHFTVPFCEVSSISVHPKIFVIQRFSHSTLFSSWETREIDVQGEYNLSHQTETKTLQKQASLKVMRL